MRCISCKKKPIELWLTDSQGSKLEEGYCKGCNVVEDEVRDYGKMEKRNPRSKRANQTDNKDTLQPLKKIDGKVVENKDFMEVYGTEGLNAYDPEKARFYEKKGYSKTKRTVVNDNP